jgi:hypothetical protein
LADRACCEPLPNLGRPDTRKAGMAAAQCGLPWGVYQEHSCGLTPNYPQDIVADPALARDYPAVVPGEYSSGVAMKALGPQP